MKVLIAIDGSHASMLALSAAAALELPAGSTLKLVSVIADADDIDDAGWAAVELIRPADSMVRTRLTVRERLESLADRLEGEGRTVTIAVLDGRPASQIVLEARRFEADLVVVGARGHSAVDRLLIGSVSSEVVDHAPCAVLVARTERVDRVLIATDGSPDATAATDLVATSGMLGDATVRVMSVVDPGMPWWTGLSPVDGMVAIEAYGDMVDAARTHAEETARVTAERLGSEHVTTDAADRGGDVGSTIVAEAAAWKADVIVLGTRGFGMVRRLLLGSVSRDVLHLAPMSVLIVRPGVADASERADASDVAHASDGDRRHATIGSPR